MLPKISVNQNILQMEYAVRGPIPMRAAELEKQGMKIIPCHIGNPQALGQTPLTYVRQVLSLVEDPSKVAREKSLKSMFEENPFSELKETDFVPDDVLALSENILANLKLAGWEHIPRAKENDLSVRQSLILSIGGMGLKIRMR